MDERYPMAAGGAKYFVVRPGAAPEGPYTFEERRDVLDGCPVGTRWLDDRGVVLGVVRGTLAQYRDAVAKAAAFHDRGRAA